MERKTLFKIQWNHFLQFFLSISVLILVIGFSSFNVYAEMPQEGRAKKMQEVNADLDVLAQEVAKLCSAPGFRGFLRSEIAKSKNRENILELDKFLDRASKQKGMPPGLAKTKDITLQAKGRLKSSGINELEGYDLYIPVKAHKQKWRGGDDFLVAFVPVDDENDIKQYVAYSVRDGKRVFLDPNNAPNTVVLMIVPEEHETHEVVQSSLKPESIDRTLPKPHFTGKDAPDKPVKQESGNSYVGIRRMFIRDVKEGWGRGDPEIKAFFGHRKGNYCQEVYHGQYSTLYFLNDDHTWKTTWGAPYTSHCAGSGSVSGYHVCSYFDSSYYNKMVLYIYEQDGGDRREKVYNLYPGVTCSWNYYSGDDYVDSGTMYRTNFSYNYDYFHNMGNAYVYWHKVH